MKTFAGKDPRSFFPFVARLWWVLMLLPSLALRLGAGDLQRSVTIDLAGSWRLAFGQEAPGAFGAPLPELVWTDFIELPGTLELAGKGPLNPVQETGQLTRLRAFDGPAWYRRELRIPAELGGRRLELFIERSRHTRVWFDGEEVAGAALWASPQLRLLSAAVRPGAHQLCILVDNRAQRRPVQAQAHLFVDGCGSNWNGLLGRLEARVLAAVSISQVQVYPVLETKALRLHVQVRSSHAGPVQGALELEAASFNHAGDPQRPPSLRLSFVAQPGLTELDLNYPLGATALTWDEFSPALYRVELRCEADGARDLRVVECGLRDFSTRGQQFTINGRPTFLRGKHDACVFPLLGHPPMEREAWEHYFRLLQNWGFNHVRFHTWIPPEAAFEAADRVGLYLQPELPFWGHFDTAVGEALRPEALGILSAFGNHPSFALMTLANEAGGERQVMNSLVCELRASDPRHLYADGSNNVLWDPAYQPGSDFFVSAKVRPLRAPETLCAARGSFCRFDGDEGLVQWGASETRSDFSAALEGLPVPFVGHEIGQWTSYPDYRGLSKYTGPLRPWNLLRFQESLARHGLLAQAVEFQRASGALAAQLYREECELAFRSRGEGGFQVLDLQDNPEQGTALVGLLDAFLDSKGLVEPEVFRRHCGPEVLLARMDRYCWTQDDCFAADLELSHYGATDWPEALTSWRVVDADGRVLREGRLPALELKQGGLRALGTVKLALDALPAPRRYDFEVSVRSAAGEARQSWPLWVFPSRIPAAAPVGVTLLRAYDERCEASLLAGATVLLIPEGRRWGRTVPGAYATDFWNWQMFGGSPGTLGLLCDPKHPALQAFPTRFYSERLWARLAPASRPLILSDAPAGLLPVVQVIDNYVRNERLALIIEARVGRGRLLVCAIDLLSEELRKLPEARQLLYSLESYAGGTDFSPRQELDPDYLRQILRPSLAEGRPVSVSSSEVPPWGYLPKAEHALDGDINTYWRAAEKDPSPWLRVELGGSRHVDTIELVLGEDWRESPVTLESSEDGVVWTAVEASERGGGEDRRLFFLKAPLRCSQLRVRAQREPGSSRPFVLLEFRVLGF